MYKKVREYIGYGYNGTEYFKIKYYSTNRNKSKMNMIDLKDSFYKEYGFEIWQSIKSFHFGKLITYKKD